MEQLLPIVWLTGNSGAGKTTLARGLHAYFNTVAPEHRLFRRIVVLDGDDMRASISLHATFSAEDRRAHNLRVARLAVQLRRQGFLVVVAVIAPFAAVRAEIDDICDTRWIYLKRSGLNAADKPYEAPEHPHCIINNDVTSKEEALEKACAFLLSLTPASRPLQTRTAASHQKSAR